MNNKYKFNDGLILTQISVGEAMNIFINGSDVYYIEGGFRYLIEDIGEFYIYEEFGIEEEN